MATSKTCRRCERELDISDFYKHAMMADGHLNFCKECTKKRVKRHRDANLERVRAYDRNRFHNDPGRRKRSYASARAHSAKYPQKRVARYAVGNAIRDGRLVRMPCEVCGAPKSEAHHHDYSKPLDVKWLCREHHMAEHYGTR